MKNQAKFAIVDEEITHISLCKSPKNGKKTFIFKAKNAEGIDEENLIEKKINFDYVKKASDENGKTWSVVYGIVNSPYIVDDDGHTIEQGEIFKSAWNIGKSNTVIDLEHQFSEIDGVQLVENAVAMSDIMKSDIEESVEKGSDEDEAIIRSGEHYIGVKIENDEIRKGIENGDIKGFSRYGRAKLIPLAKANIEEFAINIKKSMPSLNAIIEKGIFNDLVESDKSYAFNKLIDAIWLVQDKYAWYGEVSSDEAIELLEESFEEFKDYLKTKIKKSNGGNEMEKTEIVELIKSIVEAAFNEQAELKKSEAEQDEQKALIEKANNLEKENTELKSEIQKFEDGLPEIKKAIEDMAKDKIRPIQKSNDGEDEQIKARPF